MKKRIQFSISTIAFLIVALLFFAIGLGSLGSVQHTGKAYELRFRAKTSTEKEPSVVFVLNDDKEDPAQINTYYRLKHVYLNVAAIYNGESESAKITLGRGASTSASAYTYEAKLGNVKYQKESADDATITNAIGNWIEPFNLSVSPDSSLNIATYKYYKITAETCNMLVNEIVFVGEVLESASGAGTGKLKVIPAQVYSALPMIDGGNADDDAVTVAKKQAGALIDHQRIPSLAQSSFFRIGGDEVYTSMTVSEMRVGDTVYKASGTSGDIYHGDRVYNSFGTSIVALGTLIFGNSPFGLRFFPMCASFGILVFGYLFVKALTKSEKAGLIFSVIYALSCLSFGIGHFGTPLAIGIFFLTASLYFCHNYYAKGIRKNNFFGVLPLVLSGLCAACAICVNSAYLVPVLGVCGLFAAGMVRQNKARRLYLDEAIALLEAEEETSVAQGEAGEEGQSEKVSENKRRVLEIAAEYRWKNAAAPAAFCAALIVGAMMLSLLFVLPVYSAYVKLYDNPVTPKLSVFSLMAKLFAGGFVGVNSGANAWNVFYTTFTGAGSFYAVTGIFVNTVAMLAALCGIAYAVYKIVLVCTKKLKGKEARSALRSVVIPLGLLLISLVAASFGGGALAFIALAYIASFVLCADGVNYFTEKEGKFRKAAKVLMFVGLGLLCAMFVLLAIFTFSIPLPAAFLSTL